MIRTAMIAACLSVALLMAHGANLAAAEPETPAPIDWRDFVDDTGEGDHVVGEELCAAPGAVESVPKSFVFLRQQKNRPDEIGRKLS